MTGVVTTGVSVSIAVLAAEIAALLPGSATGVSNVSLNGTQSFTITLTNGTEFTVPLPLQPALDFSDPRNSFYL
jgi:hypothetical protein